jgi:hypothetical protein
MGAFSANSFPSSVFASSPADLPCFSLLSSPPVVPAPVRLPAPVSSSLAMVSLLALLPEVLWAACRASRRSPSGWVLVRRFRSAAVARAWARVHRGCVRACPSGRWWLVSVPVSAGFAARFGS